MVRVGGSVVGVHKISFLIHESHPGVVLILMYQQKCTAAVYCCAQPTRAAGERRRASDVCANSKYSNRIYSSIVVRVGGSVVGVVQKFYLFIHESNPGWG